MATKNRQYTDSFTVHVRTVGGLAQITMLDGDNHTVYYHTIPLGGIRPLSVISDSQDTVMIFSDIRNYARGKIMEIDGL